MAGIFVFVGLLGTVFGIAGSVSSLSGTLSTTAPGATGPQTAMMSPDDFASNVRGLLGGMRLAFAGTLAGLFCTIVVSAMNTGYMRFCRRAEDIFEQILSTVVIPAYKRSQRHESDDIAAAAALLSEVVQQLSTSATALATGVNESSGALLRVSEQATKTSRALTEAAQSIDQRVDKSIEFAETIGSAISGQADHLREAIRAHADALAGSVREFDAITNKIADRLKDAIASHSDTLSGNIRDFQEVSGTLASAARSISRDENDLLAALRLAAVNVNEAVRELANNLQAHNQSQLTTLSDVALEIKNTQSALRELLTRFELTLADVTVAAEGQQVTHSIRELLGKIDSLPKFDIPAPVVLAPAPEPINIDPIIVATRSTSSSVLEVSDQVRAVVHMVESLASSVGSLDTEIERVNRRLDGFLHRMDEPVRQRIPRFFSRRFWLGN